MGDENDERIKVCKLFFGQVRVHILYDKGCEDNE